MLLLVCVDGHYKSTIGILLNLITFKLYHRTSASTRFLRLSSITAILISEYPNCTVYPLSVAGAHENLCLPLKCVYLKDKKPGFH